MGKGQGAFLLGWLIHDHILLDRELINSLQRHNGASLQLDLSKASASTPVSPK